MKLLTVFLYDCGGTGARAAVPSGACSTPTWVTIGPRNFDSPYGNRVFEGLSVRPAFRTACRTAYRSTRWSAKVLKKITSYRYTRQVCHLSAATSVHDSLKCRRCFTLPKRHPLELVGAIRCYKCGLLAVSLIHIDLKVATFQIKRGKIAGMTEPTDRGCRRSEAVDIRPSS